MYMFVCICAYVCIGGRLIKGAVCVQSFSCASFMEEIKAHLARWIAALYRQLLHTPLWTLLSLCLHTALSFLRLCMYHLSSALLKCTPTLHLSIVLYVHCTLDYISPYHTLHMY